MHKFGFLKLKNKPHKKSKCECTRILGHCFQKRSRHHADVCFRVQFRFAIFINATLEQVGHVFLWHRKC